MAINDNRNSSLGNKASNAADRALGSHNQPSTTGDVVGESVGGAQPAAQPGRHELRVEMDVVEQSLGRFEQLTSLVGVEEGPEPPGRLRDRVGATDAAGGEALGTGRFLQPPGEGRRRVLRHGPGLRNRDRRNARAG